MAWGRAQAVVSTSTAGNVNSVLTATFGSNVTTGNRIVVVEIVQPAVSTTDTITDGAGNSYTKDLTVTDSNTNIITVWSAPITAGGGTAIVVTSTNAPTATYRVCTMVIAEYSGLSASVGSAAVDVIASLATNNSAPFTASSGNTATTAAANELVIGAFGGNPTAVNTPAAGTGFTQQFGNLNTTGMGLAMEDGDSGAVGVQAATFAISGSAFENFSTACIVYKLGGAAAVSGFLASVGKPGPRAQMTAYRDGKSQGGH
jgi:hypothetical protein